MALTRSEAEHRINQLVSAKAALDRHWSELTESVNGSAESPLGRAVWQPIDLLVDCLSDLLHDDGDTIGWFIWENDSGKYGYEHSLPNGGMRQVTTIGDLLDVLGY
jgi:hypothetical protein